MVLKFPVCCCSSYLTFNVTVYSIIGQNAALVFHSEDNPIISINTFNILYCISACVIMFTLCVCVRIVFCE